MKADNEIGLVLSGGGAKGAYQIGVLKAMAEYKLLDNLTSVSGTSAGGLNAIMLAGMDCDNIYKTVSKMEDIWHEFDIGDFMGVPKNKQSKLKSDISDMLRFFYGANQTINNIFFFDGGIFSQGEIIKLIDKNIDLEKLCKNSIKCYITCHKFWWIPGKDSYENFYISDDYTPCQIKNIALATAALPFIYKPKLIGGRIYDDGGIDWNIKEIKGRGLSNIPFKILIDEGYKNLIIVHFDEKKYFDGNDDNLRNVIEISPNDVKSMNTFDFSKVNEWINDGYWDAIKQFTYKSAFIDKIRKEHIQNKEKSYKWGKTKPISDMKEIVVAIKELREEIIICGDSSKFIVKLNEILLMFPKFSVAIASITSAAALGVVITGMGLVAPIGALSFGLFRRFINTLFLVGGSNILVQFIKYEVFIIDNENDKIALYLKK